MPEIDPERLYQGTEPPIYLGRRTPPAVGGARVAFGGFLRGAAAGFLLAFALYVAFWSKQDVDGGGAMTVGFLLGPLFAVIGGVAGARISVTKDRKRRGG